jgi:type IV secretion system protein VirB10
MVGTVIDRGGDVAADTVAPGEVDSPVARRGGWGNLALIGAGIGLLGAIGGIVIGYGAFHQSASTAAAAQPAKASDRAVDDVMGSPNAQRAALAGQLGQPGAAQTDIFGRPIAAAPGPQVADANGNPAPATSGTTSPTANGQQSPEQRRAEQARAMADAARRSPIMAFGNTGLASAALPASAGADAQQGTDLSHGGASVPVASELRVKTVRPRRARARPTSAISSAMPRSRRSGQRWSRTATFC